MFGDNFLQGLTQTVKNTANAVSQSAGDFIAGATTAGLVQVGLAPSSNLTAQELADGATGQAPGASLSNSRVQPAALLQRAQAVVTANPVESTIGAGTLIALAVGAYFLFGRK